MGLPMAFFGCTFLAVLVKSFLEPFRDIFDLRMGFSNSDY